MPAVPGEGNELPEKPGEHASPPQLPAIGGALREARVRPLRILLLAPLRFSGGPPADGCAYE